MHPTERGDFGEFLAVAQQGLQTLQTFETLQPGHISHQGGLSQEQVAGPGAAPHLLEAVQKAIQPTGWTYLVVQLAAFKFQVGDKLAQCFALGRSYAQAHQPIGRGADGFLGAQQAAAVGIHHQQGSQPAPSGLEFAVPPGIQHGAHLFLRADHLRAQIVRGEALEIIQNQQDFIIG